MKLLSLLPLLVFPILTLSMFDLKIRRFEAKDEDEIIREDLLNYTDVNVEVLYYLLLCDNTVTSTMLLLVLYDNTVTLLCGLAEMKFRTWVRPHLANARG
jgi:hypothetical protein